MTIATITTWACASCGASYTGDPAAMDRAADKHTKTTGHTTSCYTVPQENA